MKLIINDQNYPVRGVPTFKDPVRFCIPGEKPEIAGLGATMTLATDEGEALREITVGDYARWYISGDLLIGTNAPEPEPQQPTAPATTIEDLENALCEMDAANEARLAGVENALCELDMMINK